MKRFLLMAMAGAGSLPLHAESLGEVLERAWQRHPQAAAIAERDSESRARAEGAAALTPGPPTLSLSNLNDRLNRNRGRDEWEIELGVPMWLPGQQAARQSEAHYASGELDTRRAVLRLELAGELREAWWSLAARRQARELALRRLESARALETDVLRRVAAGESARLDANLAGGERLAAEAELGEAELALRQAELAIATLTGAAAPARLDEEQPALTAEQASGEHPRLAAALAAARLARARFGVAQQTRRDSPELAVRVMRERNEFGEGYASTVGVKVTLPFSSGPRYRQDTAAARAELAQAEAEAERARLRTRLDIEQARRALAQAEYQLALTRERAARAADNLAISERAYTLGEFDLVTLLRARAAALESTSLLARHGYERAAAQSRLNQTLGVLP